MITTTRILRGLLAASLAGSAALVASGFTARARAETSLIGWTSAADANAFDFVVDNAAGLGGAHPLSEADLPEDTSDFESGPFGHALASVYWPGATAGNMGSLAGELPLPSQLAPLFSNLNDPVRAETFYPSGPTSSSYPSGASTGVAEMKSHAGADGVTADAGLSDVTEAALFTVKGVQGSTSATATSAARSEARASFSDLSLLGGLIDIGATTSTASAISDGVSPNGASTSHLGAITVAGHTVSAGSDGLVIGPAQSDLLGSLATPTVAQVQQIISLLRLKIVPLPQSETRQAPAESITSAGLQLSFSLPSDAKLTVDCNALPPQLSQLSVLCTLPGLLQGASFAATIGRVTATAIATPPFNDSVSLNAVAPPVTAGGTGASSPDGSISQASAESGSGVGAAPAGVVPAPGDGSGPALSPPVAAGTSAAAPVGGSSLGGLVPASLSTPVRAGLLLGLLLVAAIAGSGLVRLTRALDGPPPETCPLEERP